MLKHSCSLCVVIQQDLAAFLMFQNDKDGSTCVLKNVQLKFVGEADGVKSEGGILEILANEVEVRCRPSNLPSEIELDISSLGLGQNLQVKDLPSIDGIVYVSDSDTMLVSCVGSAGGRSAADDSDDEAGEAGADSEAEESSEEAEPADSGSE